MLRFIILVFVFLQLIGCSAGYLKWKYRCYQADVQASAQVPTMPNCRVNNETLTGIDTDKDSVRDDVQRYIASIDIDHPYFIRGLTQYARALQKIMLEYDREELAQENFVLQFLAVECAAVSIFPPQYRNGHIYQIMDEVRDLHLNTFKRRSAHAQWRSFLETQLLPSVDSETACNFDTIKFKGKRLQ